MRIGVCVAMAITGCATVRNPQMWNLDEEVGVFVTPRPARFDDPPEHVDSDSTAVERRAPALPAAEVAPLDGATAIGGVARVGVTFADHLVGGLEFEIGGVQSGAIDSQSTDGALHMGIASVVGVTGRLGRIALGAELVAGQRKLERHSDDLQWFYLDKNWFLETRLRADLWLTSWLALGAYVAFDRDGTTGGGVRITVAIPDSVRRQRRSK